MSRYYHPRSATRNSPQETTQETAKPNQTNTPWFKSPMILSVSGLGLIIILVTLFIEFTTQRVIHIRADDNSDSAKNYTTQKQQHCQASIQNYKPGDVAINIPFADRPVTTQNISISSSLSLLGKCQNNQPEIKGKGVGTSLILLLDKIKTNVQKERNNHNSNPIVVTIAIQDDEPGPNQPNPNDIEKIKTLVHEITQNQGAIAFMVEDEILKDKLETNLVSTGNVQICALKTDVSNCVNWAFETARKLPSQ